MKPNLPKRIFIGLLFIISILLLLNILSYWNFYVNNLDPRDYFFRKTNFNLERNLPTIFSSILHFTAAALLIYIGKVRLKIKKKKRFWWLLGFTFFFIGLDELLVFHEKLGRIISDNIGTSGIFFFAWVIPYGIAMLILGLSIIKSLFELPLRTRLNFILAGAIFIFGAMGMEMFTGWYVDHYHLAHLNLLRLPDTFILSTIEELCEMLGISFFVFSLLEFIRKYRVQELEQVSIQEKLNSIKLK